MDKMVINVTSDAVQALGESYPGIDLTIESDLSNCSVHDWFKVFEKVLLAQGFSPYVIQKGCVELAFNEWRDVKDMIRVYEEYDLGEFDKKKEQEEGDD